MLPFDEYLAFFSPFVRFFVIPYKRLAFFNMFPTTHPHAPFLVDKYLSNRSIIAAGKLLKEKKKEKKKQKHVNLNEKVWNAKYCQKGRGRGRLLY